MPEPAVLAEGLAKTYPGSAGSPPVRAVESLSLDVEPGEVLGVLGPNGAGKTTTLKMLCGLLRPTAGTARVAGFDTVRQAPALRRAIGYMAQGYSLYPDLTAAENLHYFAGLYGLAGEDRRARIGRVADRLRLNDWLGRRFSALSGGMKRRVQLAVALLHSPRVVFLDEPTAGVDPVQRAEMWNLLYEVADSAGVTMVVSTHYMDEAERCRRVGLISGGRMPALDRPAALRASLPVEVWRLESPRLMAAERLLSASFPVQVYGNTLRIHLPRPSGSAEAVRPLLANLRAEYALTPAEPTLEDVFLYHTGAA
jgi:ABC-2 type transport system ATP-binding protein